VITWTVITVCSVALAVLVAWALPAWACARIVRALKAAGDFRPNFRGRPVTLGLGLVWLVWAAALAATWNLVSFGSYIFQSAGLANAAGISEWLPALGFSPFATVVAVVPFFLVAGAFAFGLADDTFGGGEDRGFRGHVGALRDGRLTTGMLKMVGIGALGLVAATGITGSITEVDAMLAPGVGLGRAGYLLGVWVVATLVIALSANFVNLTDLRPGRALKAYIPLAFVGSCLALWGFWRGIAANLFVDAGASGAGMPSGAAAWVWFAGVVICVLVVVFGPVIAVWRFDLGERAMLGDAGANAMGAFAGFLLARAAPLWLLGAFALALLALNLVSERVSFSAVIERVPALSWLDGLGRLPSGSARRRRSEASAEDDGAGAGGPTAEDEQPRRDDVS
jgi:UDP-GlcNAc:undecaprenyl-phosphate GlcNAc-1-phosphate transferase